MLFAFSHQRFFDLISIDFITNIAFLRESSSSVTLDSKLKTLISKFLCSFFDSINLSYSCEISLKQALHDITLLIGADAIGGSFGTAEVVLVALSLVSIGGGDCTRSIVTRSSVFITDCFCKEAECGGCCTDEFDCFCLGLLLLNEKSLKLYFCCCDCSNDCCCCC